MQEGANMTTSCQVIGRREPGGRAAPSFSVQLGSRSGRLGPGTLEGSWGLNDRGLWKLPHEAGGLLPGHSPRALGAQLCLRDAPCHVFRGRAPLAGGLTHAFLPFSVTMARVLSFCCPETGVTHRFNAGEGPGHT